MELDLENAIEVNIDLKQCFHDLVDEYYDALEKNNYGLALAKLNVFREITITCLNLVEMSRQFKIPLNLKSYSIPIKNSTMTMVISEDEFNKMKSDKNGKVSEV